jgi:hypothetical protein
VGTYYHFTPTKNAPAILTEGLKLPAETGNRNTWLGVQGDPNYIYYFGSEMIAAVALAVCFGINPEITEETVVLIAVKLPDDAVERDYDQVLYLLRDPSLTDEQKQQHIREVAKNQFGLELTDTSPKAIDAALDSIPEERWRTRHGSYRSTRSVADTRILSWSQVLTKEDHAFFQSVPATLSEEEKMERLGEYFLERFGEDS